MDLLNFQKKCYISPLVPSYGLSFVRAVAKYENKRSPRCFIGPSHKTVLPKGDMCDNIFITIL